MKKGEIHDAVTDFIAAKENQAIALDNLRTTETLNNLAIQERVDKNDKLFKMLEGKDEVYVKMSTETFKVKRTGAINVEVTKIEIIQSLK